MVIHETSKFVSGAKKLTRRNVQLAVKIDKTITLFSTGVSHNSLRLHKIENTGEDVWGISVDMQIRIIFKYVVDGVLLLDIGNHDEVYK